MVLTLPARGNLGIIARHKVSWQIGLDPAAQGAGGPHMRGVMALL